MYPPKHYSFLPTTAAATSHRAAAPTRALLFLMADNHADTSFLSLLFCYRNTYYVNTGTKGFAFIGMALF